MRGFLLLLAVAAAVAGCGGSDERERASAQIVADAAAKTTEAGTAHLSEIVTGAANGKPLGHGSVTGVVDGRNGRGVITLHLGFFANAGAGGPSRDALEGKIIYLGERAWLTGPAIRRRLSGSKRWVAAETRALQSSGLGGGIVGMGTLDPTKPIDFLRDATGKTEEVGSETVNGATTKHYRTSIDYRLYLDHVSADRRAALKSAVDGLDRILGTTRFPVEAWVAEDGTIRRVKGGIEGGPLKQGYTIDLTAIGEPISVRPPPRRLVLDTGQ